MRSFVRSAAWLSLVVVVVAACDRIPLEPEAGAVVSLALLDAEHLGPPAPFTARALLYEAIELVYRDRGAMATRSLAAELRRLHHAARSAQLAGDRAEADRLTADVRREQLRIILAVYGEPVVSRVVAGVALAFERTLRHTGIDGDGHGDGDGDRDHGAVAAITAAIDEALAAARAAQAAGDAGAALDAGTYAAGLVATLRASFADATRIPGVDQLFLEAVRTIAERNGEAAARAVVGTHERLLEEARASGRAGDRGLIHGKLAAARDEQIRVIIAVLGADTVVRLLDAVDAGRMRVEQGIAAAQQRGVDVDGFERMARTAAELHGRARAAQAAGADASALDLGSHAASLIDAMSSRLAALR